MSKLAEQLRPIAGPARLRVTADDALRHNKLSPVAAHVPFMHEVSRDVGQALALFGITEAEFERRALVYLQTHVAKMKPPVQVERHIRAPAVPRDEHRLSRQRAAARAVEARIATVIMSIDGVDIREWTIGQCLTAAKRKGHEAYVLSVIGNDYKHLPHHKRVGDVAADGVLQSIVEQGRAHVDEV